jgi:hypothetical protein
MKLDKLDGQYARAFALTEDTSYRQISAGRFEQVPRGGSFPANNRVTCIALVFPVKGLSHFYLSFHYQLHL